MDMVNALAGKGGVDAIARDLGIDEQTAKAGMTALMPAVLGGMRNQAEGTPQGIGGLGSILGGLGGGGLLDSVLGPQPTDVSQGNNVLGQIFGSKDTSRAVAADAAQRTGLNDALLKKMLPLVAMAAAGYLANKVKSSGASTATTSGGGIFGGPTTAQPVPAPSDGGLLGSLLGGGSNALNDILGGLVRR